MHLVLGRIRDMANNESHLRLLCVIPPMNSRPSTWLPRQELEIRRRFLPHWRMEGAFYYVTFNLRQGKLSADEITIVKQHIVDSSAGSCRLQALCVMPDHVHLIVEPLQGITLARLMQKFKGGSAFKVNRRRGTQGPLWQVESWDRIIRDEQEYLEKTNYILQNPVMAGLSDDPLSWGGSYLEFE